MSFYQSTKNFLRSLIKKNKPVGFRSDIDQFLYDLREKFPKLSLSQQQEIKKFKPIFYRRDHAVKEEPSQIWHEF